MKHTLRRTGEVYRHLNGTTIPVYTQDGWYEYDVHDGDMVIIDDGYTTSMDIIKGNQKCAECPIRANDSNLCGVAVKCKVTGMFRAVCRARFGVHSIDEILEDL